MRLSRPAVLVLLVASTLAVAQSPSTSERPTGAKKAGSVSLMVARPSDNSFGDNYRWFGALSEEMFYFKLGVVKGIELVSRNALSDGVRGHKDVSAPVSENDYLDFAKKKNTTYLLLQRYEVLEGGEVTYMAELLSVKDGRPVNAFEKSFPLGGAASGLDLTIAELTKTLGVKPSQSAARFLRMPVISNDVRNMTQLGTDILDLRYGRKQQAESIAKKFDKVASRDKGMHLASYLSATHYVEAKKLADAAELIDMLVRSIGPVYPDLYAIGVDGYRQARRYDDALRIAMLADKAGLKSLDLLIQRAKILQDKGQKAEAYDVYQQVLAMKKDDPSALVFLANYFNANNSPSKAAEYAKRALAKDPNNGPALMEKGKAYMKLGNTSTAISAFSSAASLLPDNPQPHVHLGDLYATKKDYSRASIHYDKAVKGMPDDLQLHLKAARALKLTKKFNDALKMLAAKETAFSRSAEFQKEIGLLRFTLKDTARAKVHLDNFVRTGEKDGEVFLILGEIYLKEGNADKALEILTKAQPLTKNKVACAAALGKIHLAKKQYKQAITQLQKVVAIKSSYPHANRMLAEAYLATGDKNKALTHYVRERTHAGPKRDIQEKIAGLYFELNSFQKAGDEYVALLRLDRTHVLANFRLAEINLRKNNVTKAESYLNKGLALGKGDPRLFLRFGKAYKAASKYTKAIGVYRQCVEVDPKNEEAWTNLVELYSKTKKDSLAAEMCLKVFALNNDAKKTYLARAGRLFEKAKAFKKAKAAYDEYLKRKYPDTEVPVRLGMLEYNDKDYARAISLLKGAKGKLATDTRILMALAESYYASKKYAEALGPAGKVLAKQSKNKRALELSALAADKSKNLAKATTMYAKYVALPSTKQHPDYAFRLGQLYEQRKMGPQAIERYKKNVAAYSRDPRSYDRLAHLYFDAQQYGNALPLLQKAVGVTGTSVELQRMLAQTLAKKDRKTDAVKYYQLYLKKAPSDSTALLELGTLYFEQKNYSRAAQELSKASVFVPKNYQLHFMLGMSYVKTKSLSKAVSPFERAHSIKEKEVAPLLELAKCFRSLKKTDELIKILRKLAVLRPSDFDVVSELGTLLVKGGKDDEALPHLQASSKLKPSDATTQVMLAAIYRKRGDDALMIIHLENALKLKPQDYDVNMGLGVYYADKGSNKKARPFLKTATTTKPKGAVAHYQYGRVLQALKDSKGALVEYKLAATYDAANLDYVMKVVELSYETGAKKTALKTVEKALTLKGSEKHARIQYWAGVLFMETGKPKAAKAYLEKAIRVDKDCAVCFDYLGDIHAEEGALDMAAKHYERSLDIRSTNVETEMKLGMTYLNSKAQDKAEQLFERAVARNSNNDQARYWLCHLYIKTGRIAIAKQIFDKRPPISKSGWYFLLSGELLQSQGANRAALDSYMTAARMLPKSSQALAGCGRGYLGMEKYNQAIMYLGQAMGYAPNDLSIMVDMGQAFEGQKNYSAALDLYGEVLKSDPENEDAYHRTARVQGRKSHVKAIETIKKGLAKSPRSTKLHLALGHEYRLTSQYDDAIDAYKKAERGSGLEAVEALKALGDIYFESLKEPKKAKGYYEKYVKQGGVDSGVKLKLRKL